MQKQSSLLVYGGKISSNLNNYQNLPEVSKLLTYFKDKTIHDFLDKIKTCKMCNRCLDFKAPVSPFIDQTSRYLFISKEPTYQDTLNSMKTEMVELDPSKNEFNKFLKTLSITSYNLTTVVNCHGKNYRNIEYHEFLRCVLLKVVEFTFYNKSKIDTIFLLGRDAVESFLSRSYSPNSQLGYFYDVDVLGKVYRVYILQHPIFIQQKPVFRDLIYSVLEQISEVESKRGTQEPYSEDI